MLIGVEGLGASFMVASERLRAWRGMYFAYMAAELVVLCERFVAALFRALLRG